VLSVFLASCGLAKSIQILSLSNTFMIRALAKFWAKRRYVWNQEREAATTDLNAKAAAARAAEKRALLEQLSADRRFAPLIRAAAQP
jgi:hypothetical protein